MLPLRMNGVQRGDYVAQVKIYGLKDNIAKNREAISEAVHSSLQEAFALPAEKRFQRFIALEAPDFIFPKDRSEMYTIIEISIFEGRSLEAKKKLISLVFSRMSALGINPTDVEITIFETPKYNWGIRGKPGDELELNYKVEV